MMQIGVLFRRPAFPVIGLADGRLFTARDLRTLGLTLAGVERPGPEGCVSMVDSTGEEFWYYADRRVLAPGFHWKRWTKRQIIDLYNAHVDADRRYSARSLSSKRVSRIVGDISDLIGHRPARHPRKPEGEA